MPKLLSVLYRLVLEWFNGSCFTDLDFVSPVLPNHRQVHSLVDDTTAKPVIRLTYCID